jgi:hypothetical protein
MSFTINFNLRTVVDELNQYCNKQKEEIVYFESNLNIVNNNPLISENQFFSLFNFTNVNRNLGKLISKYSKTFVYMSKYTEKDIYELEPHIEIFENRRENGLIVDKIDKDKFVIENLYCFIQDLYKLDKLTTQNENCYLLKTLYRYFIFDNVIKINDNEYSLSCEY